MLIGDKDSFAIECHHDPIPNDSRRVFGRMCIWAQGQVLGDINEPACMLNVTEGHLQDVLARLDSLRDPSLEGLSGRAVFEFLDQALYLDDGRSTAQITQDARRFFKFDFLTNGGESFDGTKSFLVGIGDGFRLMFRDRSEGLHCADVPRPRLVSVVREFFVWLTEEGKRAG